MSTPLDTFIIKKKVGEVGIEIECEGRNLPLPLKYWVAVPDGSLRGNCIEYILKNPVKRKELTKVLNYLKNEWKKTNAIIDLSPRTSVHVHINVQEMEWKDIIIFYCIYNILEDLLIKFCGKEREGNLFCLSSSDAAYILEYITGIVRQKQWSSFRNRKFKYGAVNFNAISKFGSLEFRTMRGTSDINLIKKWINILLKIKDYSSNFDQPKDIIEQFSAEGGERFVCNVLEQHAPAVMCREASMLVRNGVWRIQELAYIPIKERKKKKIKKEDIYELKHGLYEGDRLRAAINQAPPIAPNRVQWAIVDDVVDERDE